MECNKDEAKRAKEIAEKKFSSKDIAGAKKFGLKAQNLYPGLEGISQMLATLDVYVAAENKINGEVDWYAILGVDPLADDDTVRKHYRKLALTLHPDKNKSVGADGAFKFLSEAWSLLSDKNRRVAYDQKRNVKVFKQKVQSGSSSTPPPGANGFHNFTKVSRKAPRNTTNSSKPAASSAPASPSKQKPLTFWTVCHRCKMQYEYLRMYLYQNLLCPNCHEPFLAVETPAPVMNGSKVSKVSDNSQQRQNSSKGASKNVPNSRSHNSTSPNVGPGGFSGHNSPSDHTNFQWSPFSKPYSAASSAQAANMVHQAYERVKREREEAQAASKREEALRRKTLASKRKGGLSSTGPSNAVKKRRGVEEFGANREAMKPKDTIAGLVNTKKNSGLEPRNSSPIKASGTDKPSSRRDVSDIQYRLMEKARMEIRKKLNEWSSGTVVKSTVAGEENVIEKSKEKEKEMVNVVENGVNVIKDYENNGASTIKSIPSSSGRDPNKEPFDPFLIDVPDPDFHDFDKDRTERCIGEGQVWAAYDADDGMPRYYAMIHNVISVDPFKTKISWLSSTTNHALGPSNWTGSGFSKTCGDFRIGKHEIYHSLHSFSHKACWKNGKRGAIQIYPQKGDVWALYRNWSPDWNELTADEVIHKYDIVEVEDYEDEAGVTVVPLVKVAGFKTVFHRHLDPREVRLIPDNEIFRFSHQIPSYLLTGQEAPNAPKGCWELDPAATPLEFLQVIEDVMETETLANEKKFDEENLADCAVDTDYKERENLSKSGKEKGELV